MDMKLFRQMADLARAGDEAAADYLFVQSYRPLRVFIETLMDDLLCKARVEPEDIIQDTYVAAWPKLGSSEFENYSAFVGWLKIIAKNKVIDLHRGLRAEKHAVNKRISHTAIQESSYLDLVERAISPERTPSEGVAQNEVLALLLGQMWRLPPEYRHVIQWRFIQGVSVTEVARRLDRSEPAVHMLCHRALKKLRELLGSPSKYLNVSR